MQCQEFAEDRPDLTGKDEGDGTNRAIVDLLVEQVECSDILVCNKLDLVTDEQFGHLGSILRSLNNSAEIMGTKW